MGYNYYVLPTRTDEVKLVQLKYQEDNKHTALMKLE